MKARFTRALVVVAAALGMMACGGAKDAVVVGSKNFTEQNILGELVAQQLERHGLKVERRFYLGGTFVCHRAITSGGLDVYVEYTGTAYTAILRHSPISDPDSVYDAVKREYERRFGLVWEPPLGFDNSFAMIVRRATADSLGIRTISEAAKYAPGWRAGFGPEFMERKDGFPGLSRTYGLEFGVSPRIMDIGLMYRALADGQVDMIAGNSTDGQIRALDLFVLEDDRGYFPPYEAAPVVRGDALRRHPEIDVALRALAGRISNEEMRRMNYEVDVRHRDASSVAREFLERSKIE